MNGWEVVLELLAPGEWKSHQDLVAELTERGHTPENAEALVHTAHACSGLVRSVDVMMPGVSYCLDRP